MIIGIIQNVSLTLCEFREGKYHDLMDMSEKKNTEEKKAWKDDNGNKQ